MRFAEITAEHRRPAGRSTVTVRCPFCDVEIEHLEFDVEETP